MLTPWGYSDYEENLADGIDVYGTSGHGGYKLSKDRNNKIPENWRLKGFYDGWYEEDCGWAPICLTFPLYFSQDRIKRASLVIKDWEEWVKENV